MVTYTVRSVTESPAGISVSVCIARGGTDENESVEYLISPEFWCWGRLAAGAALNEDDYFRMEHHAAFSRALARAKSILSYSGHSRADLISRLRHYGFDDGICEETADYAVTEGLVCEDEQAQHAADTFLRRKYWGRKRIQAELAARGYPDGVIRDALDAIPDEEFARTLRLIIVRKYGAPPADPGERQKMVLSLLRLGYTGSEIKDAIAAVAAAQS